MGSKAKNIKSRHDYMRNSLIRSIIQYIENACMHACSVVSDSMTLRVAIPFSKRSFWPRDQTCISCIGRQILYHWATWKDSTENDSTLLKIHPQSKHLIKKKTVLSRQARGREVWKKKKGIFGKIVNSYGMEGRGLGGGWQNSWLLSPVYKWRRQHYLASNLKVLTGTELLKDFFHERMKCLFK